MSPSFKPFILRGRGLHRQNSALHRAHRSHLHNTSFINFTKAGDTRSRNCYQSSGTRYLHRYTCVGQFGTSFFLGPVVLHAIEHSSVPGQKLCDTWHEPCNVTGQRVVLVKESVIKLNLLTKSQHYSTCLKGIVSLTTVLYARLYREACLTQYVNRNTDRILWPTQAAWAVWIYQQLLQPTWHSLTTARMVNLTLTINSITWLKQ